MRVGFAVEDFLLFGVFRPTCEFFTHMETSPLPVKDCKFSLTYARHSWPLSSEDSLACHTYCDTRNQFIMVFPEDPWHSQLLPIVWKWNCHYMFLRLRSVRLGFEYPIATCEANALTHCTAAAVAADEDEKTVLRVRTLIHYFKTTFQISVNDCQKKQDTLNYIKKVFIR